MFDFAVIGGGIVGGFVARSLSRYRGSVCILEKENDVAMGASRANSAIVHAGFDAKEGSLKALLNVRGSEMMEDAARELGVPYKRNGSLVIGFDEDDRETLKSLLERGNKNGVRGLRLLEGEEIRELEKNISDNVKYALYAPTGAIVCPYELTLAAIGNAMDNGAELILSFEVSEVKRSENGYRILSFDGRELEARCVINCAGLRSDEVAKMNDPKRDISVYPRRGEYMVFDKECGGLVSHTLFRTPTKMGKGILVTPTVDGNLLIGPTAENIDDKTDTSTTASGLSFIIKEAMENVKGIVPSKVITSFSGLRAVGDTGDFIIDINDGFVNAAGIESPGLSSAPAIGEYICSLFEGEGLLPDAREDFNPIRKPFHTFREMSDDEKNALIKKDSAYGAIVCRCEKVTEGEIIAAIRTNPGARTLDGVKRRTRAGMGRCQGGFCMSVVVGILARELGVPYESIEKDTSGSYINLGKTKG